MLVTSRDREVEFLKRALVVALVVGAVGVAHVHSAAAGGGPSVMKVAHLRQIVGQTVQGRASGVFFATSSDARTALNTTQYVYLARGYLRGAPLVSAGEDAVRAGRLVLVRRRVGNVLDARMQFVVPDVPSGTYTAYFCDLGCKNPVGDLWPMPVRIFHSETEARLVERLNRVRDRIRSEIFRLDERFQNRLTDARVSILRQAGVRDRWTEEKLRNEIGALNARVDRLVVAQQPTWSDYSLQLALALLVLIALAFAWTRLRAKPMPLQAIKDGAEDEEQPVVHISARSAR